MSSKVVCARNGKASMESRDHHKNGASPKSQRSRKNLLNMIFFACIILCTIFTACSSPESDGKKVADKRCACEQSLIKSEISKEKLEFSEKEYSKFVNEFDSYNFQKREDVRNKVHEIDNIIQQMHNEADKPYVECLQKVDEYSRKVSEKYVTNKQKQEQFDYAISNYRCAEVKNEKIELLSSQIEAQISSIENLVLSVMPINGTYVGRLYRIDGAGERAVSITFSGNKFKAIMINEPNYPFEGSYKLVEEYEEKDISRGIGIAKHKYGEEETITHQEL